MSNETKTALDVIKEIGYTKTDIDNIIAWCEENGKQEWLLAKYKEEKPYKFYPRKDSGKKNKKGYPIYVADKSQQPRVEIKPISFTDIKFQFFKEFIPELAPKSTKVKEPTMADKLEAMKSRMSK